MALVFFVGKKDGKKHIVQDYKYLNKLLGMVHIRRWKSMELAQKCIEYEDFCEKSSVI